MRRNALVFLAVAAAAAHTLSLPPALAADRPREMDLTPVDREPSRAPPTPDQLKGLTQEVTEHPDDRTRRLALVQGLLAARQRDAALAAAEAWRAKDAYNLVAVRALGDVYMELGDRDRAERVYSAIVELLPKDADAQRALATLLKQQGDLAGAEDRLLAAVAARPGDARMLFELADVELRLGKADEATGRLEEVAGASETPESIRFPAKQRLGQAFGEARRKAKAAGDDAAVASFAKRIDGLGLKGALENDLHVYLTWDTDRTDVDLWVTTPAGDKVFYANRAGRGGEALFDDVTTGYGPESFTAATAQRGDYLVQVNYFSAHRTAFPEARGEVVVVLDEGRATERKFVLPYRLFAERQTVTVARVRVGGGK